MSEANKINWTKIDREKSDSKNNMSMGRDTMSGSYSGVQTQAAQMHGQIGAIVSKHQALKSQSKQIANPATISKDAQHGRDTNEAFAIPTQQHVYITQSAQVQPVQTIMGVDMSNSENLFSDNSNIQLSAGGQELIGAIMQEQSARQIDRMFSNFTDAQLDALLRQSELRSHDQIGELIRAEQQDRTERDAQKYVNV